MREFIGGKLTAEELRDNVLSVLSRRRSEVLVSAAVGEDCAVLQESGLLLVTGDPITGAGENAGSLAIYVSSNDIAAAGGEAVAAFLTVIAPPETDLFAIKALMKDAECAAESLNIEIAGGHTEFSDAVNRMIVSCTMLGTPRNGRVFSGTNLHPGDAVLLTGTAGREFVSIFAHDFISEAEKILTAAELAEARAFSGRLSVVREAKAASEIQSVSAMHDVTEGGVLGALSEILERANCGAAVNPAKIPVDSVTRKLCTAIRKNPLEVISSGNLLIFTSDAEKTLGVLRRAGFLVNRIGTVTEQTGIILQEADI